MAETFTQDQLDVLDALYTSGFMTEAEAEDYRSVFLHVSLADLMAPVDTGEAREVRSWNGEASRTSIGRPSFVRLGERPRVNPPTTYKDRTRKSGAKRWTRNSYTMGLALLAEMVSRRVQAWEKVPEPDPDGRCGPGVVTDTMHHGLSAQTMRLKTRPVRPFREATYRTTTPSGQALVLSFDRLTGEMEGTPGYYVGQV